MVHGGAEFIAQRIALVARRDNATLRNEIDTLLAADYMAIDEVPRTACEH